LHLNSGGASPGSTITEQNSPQRPHCRTSFVGSFTIGLVADAIAWAAWARNSALVNAGARWRSRGGDGVGAGALSAFSAFCPAGFSLPLSALLSAILASSSGIGSRPVDAMQHLPAADDAGDGLDPGPRQAGAE
jgi:hypothetical protein